MEISGELGVKTRKVSLSWQPCLPLKSQLIEMRLPRQSGKVQRKRKVSLIMDSHGGSCFVNDHFGRGKNGSVLHFVLS